MHADLEAVLARELAGFTVRTVRPLGAGVDNIAYEVNDELIVRFAAEPDHERRAEIVRREAQLLDVLRELSSLPVPEPVLASPDDGFLAYDKLPGVPLASLPGPQRVGHISPPRWLSFSPVCTPHRLVSCGASSTLSSNRWSNGLGIPDPII